METNSSCFTTAKGIVLYSTVHPFAHLFLGVENTIFHHRQPAYMSLLENVASLEYYIFLVHPLFEEQRL